MRRIPQTMQSYFSKTFFHSTGMRGLLVEDAFETAGELPLFIVAISGGNGGLEQPKPEKASAVYECAKIMLRCVNNVRRAQVPLTVHLCLAISNEMLGSCFEQIQFLRERLS
jgi:hypothetical protein